MEIYLKEYEGIPMRREKYEGEEDGVQAGEYLCAADAQRPNGRSDECDHEEAEEDFREAFKNGRRLRSDVPPYFPFNNS